uniref:ATP synthase complex subunit 8 n=2 Tax=Prioninae TaxID=41154 RepID=A0A343ERD8_9CUCU|nr:ATP synthase F0 subunit 8 [Aegosoma sinicum]YP_009723023.1 ATP synthase F0 subunit 8 [Megopis sinica]ASL05644.1 ATP synthase F0 subunit 8 [Aegosoma sinicum]QGP73214.1 ATP synthase F0 subunit 8 [Megopis sinica]QVM79156.1 ATP synthase F0 subunit 8 [Aegolipton marginale]
MPQMAPLGWLTLMLFFTLIFLIFNSMNYFSFIYPIKETKTKKIKLTFNWKW